jgi:hypothetical protein
MTKKGIKLLFLAAYLSLVSYANAQVSFFAPTVLAEPGTFITTPITVTNFQNIIGTQFSIGWNPEMLAFESVQDFGLEDINEESFGDAMLTDGKLSFLWFDVDGASVSDNSTLFSITFQVVGMTGDSSQIAFTDDPTQKIVEPQSLEVAFVNGYVKVDITDAVNGIDTMQPILIRDCYPNPFNKQTTLTIETTGTERIQIFIRDELGRAVFTDTREVLPGLHQIHIEKEVLNGPGVYFLNVEAPNYSRQQKLIVQ